MSVRSESRAYTHILSNHTFPLKPYRVLVRNPEPVPISANHSFTLKSYRRNSLYFRLGWRIFNF